MLKSIIITCSNKLFTYLWTSRISTYLGAYVFRVAISNARIVGYDGNHVTFKYYKVGSRRVRTCKLAVLDFIRRYMQHVLPKGFMKIRHYGFFSGKCSISIEQIRKMIALACDQLRKMLPVQPPEKINSDNKYAK